MDVFLSANWPSEATSEASVIKYANQEGPVRFDNPPPSKIFNFGPQCERETGRASQADVTPNGVGGLLFLRNSGFLGKTEHQQLYYLDPCFRVCFGLG